MASKFRFGSVSLTDSADSLDSAGKRASVAAQGQTPHLHKLRMLNKSHTLRMLHMRFAFMSSCLFACSAMSVSCIISDRPGDGSHTDDSGLLYVSTQNDAGSKTVVTNEGCSETEPNDNRDQASLISLGKTQKVCVGGSGDTYDYFKFTAPAGDKVGGVVTISLSDVSENGEVAIVLYAKEDNDKRIDYYPYNQRRGKSLKIWTTVTPGAEYYFRLATAYNPYYANLTTTYTPIQDIYEPNNSKEQAKAIKLGDEIEASAAVVSKKSDIFSIDNEASDWYKVDLKKGNVDILVKSRLGYYCRIDLRSSSGEILKSGDSSTDGVDCKLHYEVAKDEEYKIQIGHHIAIPVHVADVGDPPEYILKPYTLKVTQ